jgi:WD40 repeat protein
MCFRSIFHSIVLLLAFAAFAESAEPKCDRYGDPLPEGAVSRLGSLRLRNESQILSAAFTADGKELVACDASGISFWDLDTGKSLRRIDLKNANQPRPRRISSDGKTLILSGFDNVLRFVDTASGAERSTLNHAQCGFIPMFDASRDGKIVAAVHQRSIALWNVPDGKLLHEFKGPPITPLSPQRLIALTPDGKQLILTHADNSLHLVDVVTGKELRALEMPPPRPGFDPSLRLQRLMLSPDGRYVAFGGPATPFTVCELSTGKRVRELAQPQGNFYTGIAFTPNGRFLAVDQHSGIHLYGVLSGKEIRKLPLNAGTRNLVLISPDGRRLAALGDFTINLWDIAGERRLHPLVGHEESVLAMAFSPDGKRLVSTDRRNEMIMWDIASGRNLVQRRINTPAMSLMVEDDGASVRFAGYDVAVHRLDLRTGREEISRRMDVQVYTPHVALSPDGRSMVYLTFNRGAGGAGPPQPAVLQLRLHDVKINKSIVLPGTPQQGWISQIVFAPDSRRLAAGCNDGVRVWDRDTGKLLREFKQEQPGQQSSHLAFAADGRSLAFFNGAVRIREIASGADRLLFSVKGNMTALAYSTDTQLLACADYEGNIVVHSAVSVRELARWQGKQGAVQSLTFSRDGGLLASGGTNGTILIWEVPKNVPLLTVVKAGEEAAFWEALSDRDAVAANRALAALAAAPARTLPLFKERLHPIGKPLEREQLALLIDELDDESFQVRQRATRELALAGPDAADALREALDKNPSAESKRRIEDLLSRLKKGGDPRRLRFLRAIEVLERIGTPAARDILRDLAEKPQPAELRDEVRASLRRMGQKH